MIRNLQKNILFVGEPMSYENYAELYGWYQEKLPLFVPRFKIGGLAMDVSEAIAKINTCSYSGVLLESLVFPLGKEGDKYANAVNKFSKFDHPPHIWRSTGLYMVKYSIKNGLVCVVRGLDESEEELNEAKKLGARIVCNKINSKVRDTLNLFRMPL